MKSKNPQAEICKSCGKPMFLFERNFPFELWFCLNEKCISSKSIKGK